MGELDVACFEGDGFAGNYGVLCMGAANGDCARLCFARNTECGTLFGCDKAVSGSTALCGEGLAVVCLVT